MEDLSNNSTSVTSDDDKQCHLFVLVHGLWGSPNHMLTIEKVLQEIIAQSSDKKIVILRPSSFRFWKTYDGLKICGERVVFDMFYEIETLKKNHYKVSEVSFVGYSLGGLISRYVIGILESIGFFNYVRPVFFTTFATPHVGIEFFKDNYFDYTANKIGGYLFGKTGRQLFINDGEKIFVEMAKPESRYYKGLQRFEKLTLLSNIKNDRSVSFFTSFITEYSPFEKFDVVKVKYLKDLPTLKIGNVHVRGKFVDLTRSNFEINHDGKKPILCDPVGDGDLNFQEQTSIFRSSKFLKGGVIIMAACILPIWIPFILTITLISSIYSMIKIRILHYPDVTNHWEKVKAGVYGNLPVDDEDFKIGTKRRQQRKDLETHESFRGDTSQITESAMESMLYADERYVHGDGHVIGDDEVGDDNDNDNGDGDDVEDKDKDLKSTDETTITSEYLLKSSDENDEEIDQDPASEFDNHSPPDTKSAPVGLNPINLIFKAKQKLFDIDAKSHKDSIKRHLPSISSIDYGNYPLFIKQTKLSLGKDKQFIIQNLNRLNWIKIPIFLDAWNAHDGIIARRGPQTNPKGTASIALWAFILKDHLENESVNRQSATI